MAELPFYRMYPKDLNSDHRVIVMDNRTYGAYRRLLDIAWHEVPAASLPTDEPTLAAYAKESLEGWREIAPRILACFTLRNGRYYQKRLKQEYDKAMAVHKAKSDGARARWANRSRIRTRSKTQCTALYGCNYDSGSSKGEEREEGAPSVKPPIVTPPFTRAEFDCAAKNLGIPDVQRDACWAYYDSQGWQKSNGRAVTGDPRSILTSWSHNPRRNQHESSQRHPAGRNAGTYAENGAGDGSYTDAVRRKFAQVSAAVPGGK